MTINENHNQRVVFLPNSNPIDIIFSILKKIGIEETIEDVYKKFKKGESSRLEIVSNITKELRANKLADEQAILSLQEQLKISKKTADNILKDIKEKLLPFTEKIEVKKEIEVEKWTEKNIEEEPIIARPARLINENKTISDNEIKQVAEKPIIKSKIEPIENINKTPAENKNREPDKYREPIE